MRSPWADGLMNKNKDTCLTAKQKSHHACSLWIRIYKAQRLQKCQIDVGHSCFNVWGFQWGKT